MGVSSIRDGCPSIAWLVCGQPRFQLSFHRGPFVKQHGIPSGVAEAAVGAAHVAAVDAFELGAEFEDGGARLLVEGVGLQLDALGAAGERVVHE